MQGKIKHSGAIAMLVFAAFSATVVEAGVITIGSFSQPVVNVDFDSFAPGNISLGDIQAGYPTAGITSISFNCLGPNSTGNYNFNTAGGNGLACDSSGGFAVYPTGATYFDMDSITVQLDHFITEVGFQHGDRTGLGNSISFFSGGALVETFAALNFDDNLLMLRSDTAFDSFTYFEPKNWLVTELAIQTGEASVPAPATLALFGLGLAGLGWSRRKKA